MSDKAWKRAERRWAAIIGGARVPITGRGCVDVEHPVFASEVKYRQTYPGWFEKALSQCRAAAEKSGKLPIVVLYKAGSEEPVVCLPGTVFTTLARAAGMVEDGE